MPRSMNLELEINSATLCRRPNSLKCSEINLVNTKMWTENHWKFDPEQETMIKDKF